MRERNNFSMKRLVCFVGLVLVLNGCASESLERGWKEPSAETKTYREDRYQYYRNGGLTPDEAAVWAQKDAMNKQ
jgi:hypothetical protein